MNAVTPSAAVLGPNVEGLRESLIRAWRVLRPVIIGRDPMTPRIWAT
jgi:hypothetical protein